MHRKVRIAIATFLIAGVGILGFSLFKVRKRLFLPIEQRVGEAFAACLFGDREDCARLVPAHLDGCEKGQAQHCHEAAELLVQGKIVDKDAARGLELFGRACQLGRGPSCFAVGRMLREGMGVPVDPVGALTAYRNACALNEWGACQRAALMLIPANASKAAWTEAEVLLGSACKHGVSLGCYNQLVASRHVDGNADFAAKTLREVCRTEQLRCDAATLALREPAPERGVDDEIFKEICVRCGGTAPGPPAAP